MDVRDAMVTAIRCAEPCSSIGSVARIMKSEDTGFVPVVTGGQLVGVITDRDIVIRCLAEGHENPSNESVEHVMSTDVVTITPDETIDEAASLMSTLQVRRLVVVENDAVVGVLSHGNLVQATAGHGPAEQATVGVTDGA